MCIAFLRIDTAALRTHLSRPGLVIAATIWSSLALPLMLGGIFILSGLKYSSPGLFLALMFQAATSPMMASPALAALMGLDATLVLITMLTSTALIPLSAPFFIHVFVGSAVELSPLTLGVKLFVVLAGSAARWAGAAQDYRQAYHRKSKGRDKWLQCHYPVRFCSGHHGRGRAPFYDRTGVRSWPLRSGVRHVFCTAFLDHSRLRIKGP